MEAIPVEIRKRIIVLYERGKQTGEIAEGIGYCVAAVRRVRQHLRERGTLQPQTHRRGRTGKFTAERQQRLRELVAQKPDATLEELIAQMDVTVASSTMHRWLTRLGLTLKKSRCTPASGSVRTWPSSGRPGTWSWAASTRKNSCSSTRRGHGPT